MKEDTILLTATVAIIFACLLISVYGAERSCYERWKGSGKDMTWGIFQGCQIKHDGAWIPEDVYRVIP